MTIPITESIVAITLIILTLFSILKPLFPKNNPPPPHKTAAKKKNIKRSFDIDILQKNLEINITAVKGSRLTMPNTNETIAFFSGFNILINF